MARIKRKRPDRCEQCGRSGTRLFGDHVVELKDGGAPLNENNIKLLCGSCHTAKTYRAKLRRWSVSLPPPINEAP
ncbi:HNH endonuclease [Acetobacter senegalensis]|nr:HNH endonuclease signature motif containing protein [Acetobacter senegalensis]MCP1196207.1 HNH endonuclease [Acetobacter senegalensis]